MQDVIGVLHREVCVSRAAVHEALIPKLVLLVNECLSDLKFMGVGSESALSNQSTL